MFRQSAIITLLIIIVIAIFNVAIGPSKKTLSQKDEVEKENYGLNKSGPDLGKNIAGVEPYSPAPVFVLVLDDFGYSKKNLGKLVDLGINLTIAVLPDAPLTAPICSFAESNGIETILHLPMEPEKDTKFLEKDTLKETMEDAEVSNIVQNAIQSVFSARGVSNHMGSKSTKDERIMGIVVDEIKKRKMYFLDSFTTQHSVCGKISSKNGVPYIKRDIFIDNVAEEADIEAQLLKAERVATQKGFVIALGHDRMMTIKVLQRLIPQLRDRGIRFLTVSEFIKERES